MTSANGTKRKCRGRLTMSAPEGKTGVPRGPGHFRFWTRNGHPLSLRAWRCPDLFDGFHPRKRGRLKCLAMRPSLPQPRLLAIVASTAKSTFSAIRPNRVYNAKNTYT